MGNLKELGLVPLEHNQQTEIDGGFWQAIAAGVVAGLVISAMDNVGDIRRGWEDGLKGIPNPDNN